MKFLFLIPRTSTNCVLNLLMSIFISLTTHKFGWDFFFFSCISQAKLAQHFKGIQTLER